MGGYYQKRKCLRIDAAGISLKCSSVHIGYTIFKCRMICPQVESVETNSNMLLLITLNLHDWLRFSVDVHEQKNALCQSGIHFVVEPKTFILNH